MMVDIRIDVLELLSEADLHIVQSLEEQVFAEPLSVETLRTELSTQHGVIALIAYSNGEPCGYKIGYQQSAKKFYSWIGGVRPSYRGQGIAKLLMTKQHELATQKGHQSVVTHTQNRYRAMLVLNLMSDFQITGVKTNLGSQEQTIIMEKKLN